MPTASPAATPRLRVAVPSDRPAIEALLREAGLPTAGVADLVAVHAADFVIAEAFDDRGLAAVVAVAGLEVCCDTALLRSVAVRPEWRLHGLGQTLVRRVVCEAEGRGLRALYLLTMTAEHYFPRFGFARVDRADVPAEIAATLEFRSACPSSATAMVRPLAAINT